MYLKNQQRFAKGRRCFTKLSDGVGEVDGGGDGLDHFQLKHLFLFELLYISDVEKTTFVIIILQSQ